MEEDEQQPHSIPRVSIVGELRQRSLQQQQQLQPVELALSALPASTHGRVDRLDVLALARLASAEKEQSGAVPSNYGTFPIFPRA